MSRTIVELRQLAITEPNPVLREQYAREFAEAVSKAAEASLAKSNTTDPAVLARRAQGGRITGSGQFGKSSPLAKYNWKDFGQFFASVGRNPFTAAQGAKSMGVSETTVEVAMGYLVRLGLAETLGRDGKQWQLLTSPKAVMARWDEVVAAGGEMPTDSEAFGLAARGGRRITGIEPRHWIGKKWRDKLQDVYSSFEEFEGYDENFGIAERLGYDSAQEAWDDNPMVEGGTSPSEYRNLSRRRKASSPSAQARLAKAAQYVRGGRPITKAANESVANIERLTRELNDAMGAIEDDNRAARETFTIDDIKALRYSSGVAGACAATLKRYAEEAEKALQAKR